MRKIKQTVSGKGYGNCTGACISSLLDIPLKEFQILKKNASGLEWLKMINNVLKKYGYYMLTVDLCDNSKELVKGKSIVCIKSKLHEGQLHSVIVEDGICIHDPTMSEKSYDGEKVDIEHIDLLIKIL